MAKMGSVDELFGNDIIDDVAANTEDAQITFDSFGNPDHSRTDENDLVEIDDASFDELFAAAELADIGSGIGEADDGLDGEGVPIPEELQGGEEPKKKKDKRTARSQAHAKKKASSYDALPDEEADGTDGIGGADLMESSIMAEDDDPVAMSGYTETEEILDISHRPKAKSKKKMPAKSEIIYETEEVGDTGFEYEDDGYEQVDLPDWADSIRRKVNANVAHAFLLNGNVRDYMVRNISIIDGIVAVLDPEYENFDIIARYDQAHGISFYGHDIETGGTLSAAGTPRTLADAYKERFIAEMKESQIRMSVPATEEIPNRDPVALFTIISDMFDHPSKTREAKILLFIDYSDLLVPDASSAQMKPEERKLAITLADIGRSQAADDAGNVMIFITDDMTQLSTRIRSAESRIEQIKIPIPNRAEREDFIENVLDVPENVLSDGTQVFAHADSISKETFAINSAGLSRIQIEDIVLRALSEDEPLSMQLMKERKQEIIREDYDDVLEIIDPKNGFEKIGGMEYLKEFFVQEVIEPVHAGEREAVAMGCLLTGAPGVGKTMISKAVAKEAGMNFVALNLNRIMEKWVGSTERNLDRALDCALAMAPTIIFIDEIDEALPNRADPNASSVNKRINQRLLTFFSDTTHRGEVIILAATNYPEKIDPAFKRAGRFDVRVPVFAPDGFDRMRIMRAIAGGRGYSFSWFEDPDKLVDNPFTRAEEWVREGNVPQVRENVFVGDREMYTYTITNALGTPERHDVYLPCRLINILGRDKITLQELYENINILLADMPTRQPDASTGEIETDEVYSAMILEYLHTKTGILGSDSRNIKMLHKRIWRWETIYSTFIDQTFRMTGAELDVVMNKAINLFKKWKRRVGQDKVDLAIEKKIMADEKDIPWSPFLLDACRKTVNAVAGIKEMEDMALINTSDTDFIPDALYAELDDGRQISYRERHEELAAKQTKSTLG